MANRVLILNLCSPYDGLYTDELLKLLKLYKKIHIITDNKNIISNCIDGISFSYCKASFLNKIIDISSVTAEIKEAIRFDRYCSYYPKTLFFPEWLNKVINSMTANVIESLKKDIIDLINPEDKILYLSEPPASAVGVFMDIYLKRSNIEPLYFTNSRIFPGMSILTKRNDGDANPIHINMGDKNKKNQPINSRTSLISRTNRSTLSKALRLLAQKESATSIYPTNIFRLFLVWRHIVGNYRRIFFDRFLDKHSFEDIKKLFPNKKISIIFLQFEPEVSTLYWMRGVGSQMEWIKNKITTSKDCVFLIKEHTHFLGYRPINDYYDLINAGNVFIVKNEKVSDLIRLADEIISFSGTVGFECAQRGYFKKFIYGGNPFYHELIDSNGASISETKLLEYKSRTIRFESDPAMANFSSLQNKLDFIGILEGICE